MTTRGPGDFVERIGRITERLDPVRERAAAEFASGRPFPHVVLDGLLDDRILECVLDEFPEPDAVDWIAFDTPHERKLATRGASQIGPRTRALIGALNGAEFIEFVEDVTGIRGLVPDPHLDGGGLHQILPGGKLGIHSDFLVHQRLKLDRRLNLILYLNKDWEEAWGGHLELWRTDMSASERRVLPVWNRIVLFTTTATSFHGHPEPLSCPKGRSRKSIALYYYTNGRPAEETVGIRPTVFQLRPNERAVWSLRQVAKRFLPPILNDLRYLRRRRD